MPSVIVLCVVMLYVIMPNVVAPSIGSSFRQNLSPGASGGIQTLDLRIIRRMFYHNFKCGDSGDYQRESKEHSRGTDCSEQLLQGSGNLGWNLGPVL